MSGDLFARAPRPRDAAAKRATPPAEASLADDHRCAVCRAPAGFGFGVALRRGRPGRWACLAHRAEVEAMVQ